MNASNFSSQCLVLDETQTSNSFKLYSWSNFELTWTQVRPPKPNFEPVLNQKWAKPAEIWKTVLNNNRFVYQNRTTIQKNSFEPSKKSQNSEPTNWVRLNIDTRSLRCLSLGSMNRKWNLTWQHKTLLGIWKICTLVSLWNGQHQCFFFIVQRSTLCIQK